MADELTKALLLEEVVDERIVGEALFVSVTAGVPLVHALTDTGAVSTDVLLRYLARADAPFLKHVAPALEVMDRLPAGLCARLLAVPVRRDAITGTIDVVVPDPSDDHPAQEIAFHLGAPVRLVRAPVSAIEDALRRLRAQSVPPPPSRAEPRAPSSPPRSAGASRDDERLYDSRPRSYTAKLPPPLGSPMGAPAPGSRSAPPPADPLAALRPSRVPTVDRHAHVAPAPTSVHPAALGRKPRDTPPWGTPVHGSAPPPAPSDPPTSALGSEIPIPLTRRTFVTERGGTQRPPPPIDPTESPLGEGYAVDPAHFREIVEVHSRRSPVPPSVRPESKPAPAVSFIPGAPPPPGNVGFAAFAPHMPFADIGGILAALRAAGSRDEILELVLTGARMFAFKVALFVVKRGGYVGWSCTPEFGDRAALQTVLVPVDVGSVLDEAVGEGLYLGPMRHDEVHLPILRVMRGSTRDVAAVPIRVAGKVAVVVLADELGDTMMATRRLEELARAAGEAFTRIVRQRR